MPRTVEAIIDRQGSVKLLEQIELDTTHRALVTILEQATPASGLRPYGLCAGEFTVPDDFDAPLPEDILVDFEGS